MNHRNGSGLVVNDSERLLTAQELADYLEIPLATVYAWRYRREGPPGFRVGRHLRFRWGDIQVWIRDQIRTNHPFHQP